MRCDIELGCLWPPSAADDQSGKVHGRVKERAREVLELLRRRLPTAEFVGACQSVKKLQRSARLERKRKAALEAVADPELSARKRIAKNAGKRQAKQRKRGRLKHEREVSGSSVGVGRKRARK